jgi:hypothetical protein
MRPTIRPAKDGQRSVFDTYWHIAGERQAIFLRRISGQSAPWTQDAILAQHKFCSTFRAADRESQYLIRQLYAEPAASKADLVFRAVAMRIFSKGTTWDLLTALLGHQPRIADVQDGSFAKALDEAAERLERLEQPMYTAAFMVAHPESYTTDRVKHHGHAALFEDQFVTKGLADRVVAAASLADVYGILHEVPYIGDFTAYQMAIDVNYSSAVNFSENDFTKPGPGAVRGLQKVFLGFESLKPDDPRATQTIMWMVENQDAEFERLGIDFRGLYGRKLHAIDCQGLFCETDKYSRVAFPELASNRIKIKAEFKPTVAPMAPLFFPPKWGINDALPKHPVLGVPQRDRQAKLFGVT